MEKEPVFENEKKKKGRLPEGGGQTTVKAHPSLQWKRTRTGGAWLFSIRRGGGGGEMSLREGAGSSFSVRKGRETRVRT